MNIADLKLDTHFLAGSTSGTYPDASSVRNMNVAYQDVARTIWESDGVWSFDDNNNTDAPIAYRTVANASASYVIPTTAIRINGVEIKNGDGQWSKLKPLDVATLPVSPEEYFKSAGMPLWYQLEGSQIRLYPPPGTGEVTMSSGMAVRLARSVTEMASSATTTVPGFAVPFHRILSYAAAIDFTHDNVQRQFLVEQKDRLEKAMRRFYANRASEMKTKINPRTKRRWRNFI